MVYDLIYTTRPTQLLREAAALRLWSGQQLIPMESMRRAALARLEAP